MYYCRDKIEVTEKNVADVVVKKLAELEACKTLMEEYQQSIEVSLHFNFTNIQYISKIKIVIVIIYETKRILYSF